MPALRSRQGVVVGGHVVNWKNLFAKKNKKSGETVAKELQGLVKLSLKPIHLIFVCLIR